jgi:hypothetical protein
MSTESRASLTYVAALLSGAVLFFLCFAAIFTGSWPLLCFFLLCYAAAGALGVWVGGVAPAPLALALVVSAVPWVLWLFPASAREDGVLRALMWPGLGAVMAVLAFLGARASARFAARRASDSQAA